jgi:glycine dehydrogenase subunit 2
VRPDDALHPAPGHRQALWDEPLLFEYPDEGEGFRFPDERIEPDLVPANLRRDGVRIPNLTKLQMMRHYVRLSQKNFGVDSGVYLLGSCTMKYNPKLNEELAVHPAASDMHPYLDEAACQGSLEVLYELQEALKKLSGMDAVSLQPAAGAQGEYAGVLIARKYHETRGDDRDEIILPDSAHGTNFSSAAMAGFKVIEIPSTKEGTVDVEALKKALGPRTAAFMITNPSTLGIFEDKILEIAKAVHAAGALLYYDGANLNAIMGITSPGAMGFDIVHINTHKTLSTPHGGGGPGAGPVGVKAHLKDFLPVPMVVKRGETFHLDYELPHTIGKLRGFYGNFGILLRAYAYILANGGDGLTRISKMAVLNSNYMKEKLKDTFELPGKPLRKHEFVLSARKLRDEKGIRALDIAKRLLDYGYHAPTIYFPHIVEEAIMIEPTEAETKADLDRVIEAFKAIAAEDPELVRTAPHNTAVARVDEVGAARNPILRWTSPK